MTTLKLIALSGAVVALTAAAPRRADACSTSECRSGYFVPRDGATVPANLPALYWRPMSYNNPAPANVTLATTTAPATLLPFTATRLANDDYLLVPDVGLIPGTTYVLSDASVCASNPTQRGPNVSFTAGPAAPLPTQLGTLSALAEVQAEISLATARGSCSSEALVASASLAVALAPDAGPWREVLHHATFVDGTGWGPRDSILSSVAPGASWRGRGTDLVYSICRTDDPGLVGLSAGAHTVEMRATIPGTTVALTSASTAVTLACQPEPPMCNRMPCPPGKSGGCATSRPGAAPGLALALGALLLRRRRHSVRRNRTHLHPL